jgi:tripartite-type tricarboxylate transporter receptor subunit TctC
MIHSSRRAAALALVASCLLPLAAHAQTAWPTKPVRIVVPLGAGGAPDVLSRQLAQILSEKNGQSFVVDNRPGANTIIGTDVCAKAPPDGSTLCMVTGSSLSINPFVYRKLPYDVNRDFEAVAPLAVPDMVLLAAPSLPVANFQELVAYAKANPAKVAYASFGNGSDTHLTMEWIKRHTGTSLLHVPFNGFGPIMQAFNTGDVQLAYVSVGNPGIVQQVKSGKMRALAVLAPTRSTQLPDVPTFAEVGLGQLKGFTWFGYVAPAGVPRDVVRKLNTQIAAALQTPAVKELLATMAMRTSDQSPEEFRAFLQQDREIWKTMTRESGVTLD